jgi:hypothetical protein
MEKMEKEKKKRSVITRIMFDHIMSWGLKFIWKRKGGNDAINFSSRRNNARNISASYIHGFINGGMTRSKVCVVVVFRFASFFIFFSVISSHCYRKMPGD